MDHITFNKLFFNNEDICNDLFVSLLKINFLKNCHVIRISTEECTVVTVSKIVLFDIYR